MESFSRGYPQYEIHFLDVGDADCIAIRYKPNAETRSYVALIDAGNVSDAPKIKKFLKDNFGTLVIDLAVCTHPDCDHKGGFFGLLEDDEITVHEFWLKNPARYIEEEDFAKMKRLDSMIEACARVYNHPANSSKNLLKIAFDNVVGKCYDVSPGARHDVIPITVLGPSNDYYRQAAVEIVSKFAELTCEPDNSKYDELEELSEGDAKSVIDTIKEESPTNKGSLILCFKPTESRTFLLAGDAAASSLRLAYDSNRVSLTGCVLKVPHHGSKHNLNSSLIDDLKPTQSVVSAAGTKMHPSSAIVRYLSKYGNVYSTHKSGELYYSDRPTTNPAKPLKKRAQ